MRFVNHSLVILFAALGLAAAGPHQAAAQGGCCVVPDNGAGTAAIPPLGCSYQGHMEIVDGLPPGSTIQINTTITAFSHGPAGLGGGLGGTQQEWGGQLGMQMNGTGAMLGYNRFLIIPLPLANPQRTHSAPRIAFAPVQSFNEDLYMMFGQIAAPGDPDFDLLRISAGTAYGMPSPGHTILGQTGSSWAVDSFFDINYRIDFVGHPGGPFGGMSGSTTRTHRHSLCPGTVAAAPAAWSTLKALYR